MNRRQMLTTTGLGVVSIGVMSQVGCKPKNLSLYVQTVVGALQEISPLLPSQAQFISKIVTVAADFDAAYKRGDFESATTLFSTIVSNVSQLISDIGTPSPQIKVALAVAGIALRAIATLLASQATPAIAAQASKAAGAQAKAVNTVRRLSNPQIFDDILNSLKQ